MEDDVSEKPVAGMSYYQVLTGLPPAPPKPRQEEKKVEQESQRPSDDLPPSGFTPRNIQRNRNTLPKARQKTGAPPEEVLISDNLSRTVSGENVSSQTYYNRGRGRGNYQNSRGSQSTYRGNSHESSSNNHSNSLPRSRGGSSRGRGQYESHGSLPRRGGIQEAEKSDGYYKGSYENNSYGSLPRRGGRQEGDGYYKGSSENRGNGRGRGRGYYQGNASSQEQIGSRDSVTRAPSQRRIDSMQRRRKMQIDKTKSFHEEETPRARSLPRNPVKRSLPDLMTNSFSSSQSVWSPNGKCPSFADILKRGSEEALEQIGKTEFEFDTKDTAQLGDEVMSTIETEETYHEEKSIENLMIISQSYASTRKRFISH